MSNTRKPGYYWVKVERGSCTEWQVYRWVNDEWHNLPLHDKIAEINETRIPSPDESRELPGLLTSMIEGKVSFNYDAEKNVLTYHTPAAPKIIDVTVAMGDVLE